MTQADSDGVADGSGKGRKGRDGGRADQGGSPGGMSRRQFVGTATAVGAAVVWTSQFPFAGAAIGQTLHAHADPAGPTGPASSTGTTGSTGTSVPGASAGNTGATGSTGATGTVSPTLASTGVDVERLGAVGSAAVIAGGAILWFRRRGGESST